MKKEIVTGILLFIILTPIFVFMRLDNQQRHALFVGISEKKLKIDKVEKPSNILSDISKVNNNVIIKPGKKVSEAILNTEIKKVETNNLKPEIPMRESPWKNEKPAWNNKPVIGLKRTKLYYKPGDMGYYTYRNLRNEVDYFGTPVEAEKAGYKSARNKEKDGNGS